MEQNSTPEPHAIKVIDLTSDEVHVEVDAAATVEPPVADIQPAPGPEMTHTAARAQRRAEETLQSVGLGETRPKSLLSPERNHKHSIARRFIGRFIEEATKGHNAAREKATLRNPYDHRQF